MEELEKLIYQLKTMEIRRIQPIELSENVQKILGINEQNQRKNYLNKIELEFFRKCEHKCCKCERLAQYKDVLSKTYLCWNHSIN